MCQTGQVVNDTAILCLPPIMEEMNMSRAVMAKQCQHLAGQGYPCFTLDYYGCGDSEGTFEQADCSIWMDNILSAMQWLSLQGINNVIIFAYRFSALLVGALQSQLKERGQVIGQVFFKPILQGNAFVKQLKRLNTVSAVLNNKAVADENEIAGYRISPLLISASAQWSLKAMPLLFETVIDELATERISPAVQHIADNNPQVTTQFLACPAFWQIPEVFNVQALNEQSVSIVRQWA